MKVAIIGAGAAGLATARHVSQANEEIICDVFEQTGQLGGTWVYTEQIGFDKFGLPVHSSMYKGLKTNLPKEIMGFPDFPIPENKPSYLPQEEILQFLIDYANHFNFKNIVKFYHCVRNVKPNPTNKKWIIYVEDVFNKEEKVLEYDSVIVCNGHYYDPVIPELDGIQDFKGQTCHSHDYRMPDHFQDKNILIIGAGPSGMDIALQVSKYANQVYLSHHLKDKLQTKYPGNVQQKPDVLHVYANTVKFFDDTIVNVDVILYCTGYNYKFPFLDPECKITINDNYIQPLYKHMINIEYPSMCFIGIPFNVCAFQMFDLQARYYVKYLIKEMHLPSKQEMYQDMENEMNARWKKGYIRKQAHSMGPDQADYYKQLATAANTTPIAPVIVKLREASAKRLMSDLLNFRNDVYKIIDDETFIKVN